MVDWLDNVTVNEDEWDEFRVATYSPSGIAVAGEVVPATAPVAAGNGEVAVPTTAPVVVCMGRVCKEECPPTECRLSFTLQKLLLER
jgi:hypothetical protein